MAKRLPYTHSYGKMAPTDWPLFSKGYGINMSNLPLIAITIGDPAGIGPEIVVKSLSKDLIYGLLRPLVIGDGSLLRQTVSSLGLGMRVNAISNPKEGLYSFGTLDVLDLKNVGSDLRIGEVQASAGKAAFEYFEEAVKLAQAGSIAGICTAPLSKAAMRLAGVPFLDHTEILEHHTGSKDLMTMFTVRGIKVFFMTRHIPLRRVPDEVTEKNLLESLDRIDAALKEMGFDKRQIAVAALNPHAGEEGLLGNEEIDVIEPAIRKARERGIDAVGPVVSDTLIYRMERGMYDAALTLYHDQGHIATKSCDFERTISVTTGLPFIRTSVDHGTAFDIAGKGVASSISMEEAVRVAGELAARKSISAH